MDGDIGEGVCSFYLPADKHAKLHDQYDHICRQLSKMMDDAPSWCGMGGELREMPAEYFVAASEREERKEREEESVRAQEGDA